MFWRCRKKPNLLVIAGAGSAIDFGMPSVSGVHTILSQAAARFFPLVSDPTKNLYDFLHEQIAGYWSAHVPAHLGKFPNFEDVLGAISELAATRPAGIFTGALGAFVKANGFPEVIHIGNPKPVDGPVLAHLGEHLVDALLDDFRNRCRNPNPAFADNVKRFRKFFAVLTDSFNVAVVTTNYDDLIYRALPGIETGFDLDGDGLFKPGRIMHRKTWPCLLHQHGSVHFDMDIIDGDLHGIKWQEDLTRGFHQNSFGRSRGAGASGSQFPTSSIIAGYGKSEQIGASAL